MARGLCFKPRPPIRHQSGGPVWPRDPPFSFPFNRNRFHYNWHWHWDYGNGDTGNQGPHQFDIARWGLGKNEHPVKVSSFGGYFNEPSSQETPDTQTALYEYADGTLLE